MKIIEVVVEHCRLKREVPIRNGRYTYSAEGHTIVRVHTDDGIEGIGFTHAQPGPDLAVYESARALSELAVGLDIFQVEQLWDRMFQPKIFGRRGLSTRAMSAIDIAVWDAIGKTVKVPLYKLLGGFRTSVPAYLAGGYYIEGKGLEGLVEELRGKVRAGARVVKMKVGGAPMHEDVERVRAAREALGPDIGIMVDANNAYSVLDAIKFARRIEELDPFWFEEPIHAEDYDGLAKIKAATSIPIAVGENEYTRYGFRDLIKSGGADILQADANILGGITEWRHVASMASAVGLQMAPHGSPSLHVHLVAAVSNGMIVEYVMTEGKTKPLFQFSLSLDDKGMVSPPDVPGTGITINEAVLAENRLS
ncbi:MAG TPA: mandelate racemase/muconate lactonizing enzyme family protein [Spirochaetia bacterium]|nr:mandelate racemase/muconate lactonizing enzyme family protein [Spirochaetia bacterium]